MSVADGRAATGDSRLTTHDSRLQPRGFDFSTPVWIAVALFLVVLVALPIGWVLVTSLRTAQASLTLANYMEAFTDRDLLQPILVTLGVGLGVGFLSVLVGAPMGWLVARTDLPGRRLIKTLVLASFVTPPFLGAFCWTLLAGPNAGVINTWWRDLTGATTPLFNVYSIAGLIFVTF